MPISQPRVLDQRLGAHGVESCGYHTFKNSLLALMLNQGLIDQARFEMLLVDQRLGNAIINATVTLRHDGSADLDLPGFLELLKRAKAGSLDFSQYGISKEQLMQLALTPDTTQKITVANYFLFDGAPGHGLGGMEEDLLVAAATVQLARTKGKTNHVFALGLDNTHWVTASVSQNDAGVRTWQFMDSFGNQRLYQTAVVNKIEGILNKSPEDLASYLREAYENSSRTLFRRYKAFFDESTGKPLDVKIDTAGDGNLYNAKEFFIDQKANLERFASIIEQRFQFMQSSGWLESKNEVEKKWVLQLYSICKFFVENTSDAQPQELQVKNRLQPMYDQLKKAIGVEEHEESVTVDIIADPIVLQSPVEKTKPVISVEAEAEEVARIQDNRYSIKGHFDLLFEGTLAKREVPEDVEMISDLVDEDSLVAQLSREYPGKNYVVMCYAHKPNSPALSPFFPKLPRAHTSVLLCKVNHSKIEQVLNIDGYNNPSYVDITGEHTGIPNPHIQQRLVIKATGTASGDLTPVQRASWQNMNCPLYAVTFIERLLVLFREQPFVMENLFPADRRENISPESTFLLEEGLLRGLVGKYVRREQGRYLYDEVLRDKHHAQLRDLIARQYAAQCAAGRAAEQAAQKAKDTEAVVRTSNGTDKQTQALLRKSIEGTIVNKGRALDLRLAMQQQASTETVATVQIADKDAAVDSALVMQQQASTETVVTVQMADKDAAVDSALAMQQQAGTETVATVQMVNKDAAMDSALAMQQKAGTETVATVQMADKDAAVDSSALARQQQEAIEAVAMGTPKATEGFSNKLVRAITWLLETIREGLLYIGRKIGLVS